MYYWSFILWLGCAGDKDSGALVSAPSEEPQVSSVEPSLRRLTISQYNNIITDVFGEGLLISQNLEPDVVVEGFRSLGAAISSISPVGVERYEQSSLTLTSQIIEEPDRLSNYFDCELDELTEDCLTSGIEQVGMALWRRPLTSDEVERVYSVYQLIESESDSITALQYTMSTLLQSPFFLYRIEMNFEDTGPVIFLDDVTLASRLSFLLWNSGPDTELMSLALDNSLQDQTILEEQVDRMIVDDRFQNGLSNFFDELFHLYELDDITKDPLVFTQASPELYTAAKEETFRTLLYIVNNDLDFRDVLTTQTTFVERRLASLYEIPAPSSNEFGEVYLERADGRRGILTQASMLNLHAHATASSPTLRGVFIRKTLLCQMIPPPPANVDTSIPEATEDAPTMRERLEEHFEDPSCAGCHKLMDLVGLGLENFDGIGKWRDLENNATINPSGNIDGTDFNDAWQLGEVVRNHPNLGPCLSDHLYSYALGHRLTTEEDPHKDWLYEHLEYSNWSFISTMKSIALSEAFRSHGTIE